MSPYFSKEPRLIGPGPEALTAAGANPQTQIVAVWFGCRLSLRKVPAHCPVRVSGRSQFKLFVNGESRLFGPCRSARDVAYLDELDLAPWLRAGENRLVWQVLSYPEHPRTLQLCAHDAYEDCPYYEQLMYACDTRLEILFTYAATDDVALPRQAIRLFAASALENGLTQARFPARSRQVIPMFALYFVLMLEEYLAHTGDAAFVAPYLPLAERIVETFLTKRCKNGLLAPQGYWDYFDATREWEKNGPAVTPTAVKDGASALQNLFFVYACQSLCRILPQFHRADLAAHYRDACRRLLTLVEDLCYDTARGLYREGPETVEYSQHTQIYAVLTGLAQGEKAQRLMERVLTDKSLIPCSFMQQYSLFRALEKVGMYARTGELWQTWQHFIDLHCTTFPETPYTPRSDCHAWSALPLWEFARDRAAAHSATPPPDVPPEQSGVQSM